MGWGAKEMGTMEDGVNTDGVTTGNGVDGVHHRIEMV